jgi:sugar phosphate isomerase/epimerase
MKLLYTVTTPDAKTDPVLAWKAPLEEVFAQLAGFGYDGVEIMVRHPESIDRETLNRLLAQHRLEAPIVGTGPIGLGRNLSLSAADANVRSQAIEAARLAIEFCAGIGAILNIGQFRGAPRDPAEQKGMSERFADSLQALLVTAEASDVRIALEPQNRFQSAFLRTVAETMALIEAIGSPRLGLVVDTFHMNIEESDFCEPLRRAGERVFHVHFADNQRGAPGTGHIPFDRIVQTLREIRYSGSISLEVEQTPTPAEAARRAIEGTRRFVPEEFA